MTIRFLVRPSPSESFPWECAEPSFEIGRAAECKLRFVDSAIVSSRHARVESSGGTASLTDLNSTNGTFLNGQRVTAAVALRVGDQIQFGQGGPRLDVLEVVISPSPPSGVGLPPLPGVAVPAAPGRAAVLQVPVSALPTAAPGGQQPAPASGTQALLVNLQQQNQRWMLLMGGGLGVLVLVVMGAVFLLSGKSSPTAAPALVQRQPEREGRIETPEPREAVVAKPSPAAPQPSQEPPAPQQVDWDRVVAPLEPAIVWLGVEGKPSDRSLRFPVCTGWIAGPKSVVTTGTLVHYLQSQHKPEKGFRVFVCLPEGERFIYAGGFKIHPKYRPENAADGIGLHNNLGVVLLEETLPSPCPWTREPKGKVDSGTEVMAAGFPISEETKPLDPTSPPKLIRVKAVFVSGGAADSSVRFPRRVLDLKSPANVEGAPVFGADGSVIGVVVQVKEKSYAVLCAGLAELLD